MNDQQPDVLRLLEYGLVETHQCTSLFGNKRVDTSVTGSPLNYKPSDCWVFFRAPDLLIMGFVILGHVPLHMAPTLAFVNDLPQDHTRTTIVQEIDRAISIVEVA